MDQQNAKDGAKRQHHQTEEFKRSVIEHWLSSGKPAHQVAREFGIHPWNLRDWRHRYAPPPKAADDPLPETPEAMRREIAQLRKELARVSTQRDILKKTLGIISEP